MADAKLTALTAASALDGTELFYGSQGGAQRKITGAQIKTYTNDGLPVAPYEVKPPTTTSFPFEALGTGVTFTKNDGTYSLGLVRTDNGIGAVERCAFRGKAVPAGAAWDASIGLWTSPFGRTSKARSGLSLHESSTGKTLSILHSTEAGSPNFYIFAHTNLDTFTALVWSSAVVQQGKIPVHFRVTFDDTSYIFKISHDFGESWETVATVAKGTYFTTVADKVGVILNTGAGQTAGDCRAAVFYYDDPDIP